MNPIQAVIDTNVLVAAWHSKNGASFRLVSLFIEGDKRWEWNVSTAVLLEYEELLVRRGFEHGLVNRFLDDLACRANRIHIHFLTRPALLDADDEFLLELAVASGSGVIVSFNTANFVAARAFGIRVLAPREFLTILERNL